MEQKIKMSCSGLSALKPKDQFSLVGKLGRTVLKINKFLIDSLEEDFHFHHEMDLLKGPEIVLKVRWGGKHDKINETALFNYLGTGRHCIFDADYSKKDCLQTVMQQIAELSMEADSLVVPQGRLFDVKRINRIRLAQAMEKVTCIPVVNNRAIGFGLSTGDFKSDITCLERKKAEDLLGGRWKDSPQHYGEFLLGNPEFRNIEKSFNATKDKANVVVFITDVKWIDDFNADKIKLGRGSCIKSKYWVDRSQLGRKFDVYYLTEIQSPVAE